MADGTSSSVTLGTVTSDAETATGETALLSFYDPVITFEFGNVTLSAQTYTISTGSAFIYVPQYVYSGIKAALPLNTAWVCDDYGC